MPTTRHVRSLLLLALTPACTSAPSEPPAPAATRPVAVEPPGEPPPGRLSGDVRPVRYALELTIDPDKLDFRGRTRIELRFERPSGHIWLHGKDLDVRSIALTTSEGETVDATYEQKLPSGVSLVSLAQPVSGPATLELDYEAPFDDSLNGLYRVERDGAAYAATQFQPLGARKVFPGFDEPGFKVPFDITLRVPAEAVAVTTTPETARAPDGDGLSKRTFATTEPLPTYLLAFAVGPYDVNDFGALPPNEVRERPLPLRGIAARGLKDRLDYALENTEGLLGHLEAYFGSPYPYRKLDLIATPENFGGAMENVGAITYGEYLLLMDEEAPVAQRRAYTVVHAHEMAHMWFGDLVTPKWWDDLWLNESFATWMMYKIADRHWPEGGFSRQTLAGALGAMSADSLASARQIREPVKKNEAIADAFDGITYRKGGGVLAMLEAYAGEAAFRDGVRLHMERFAHGVADASDFMASLAEGSGKPELEPAFRSFIEQPGVPLLSVRTTCGEEGAEIRLEQTRYAPLGSTIEPESGRWTLPVCLGHDGGRTCLVLEDRAVTERLDACPSVLHPNAGGAGYYRFSVDEAGWAKLAGAAAELDPAEALVLVDSLDAAFRAGRVAPGVLLGGLAQLARHEAWDVTRKTLATFEELVDDLVAEGSRGEAAAQALARRWFGPRYAALRGSSTPDAVLLRQALFEFLVTEAEVERLRAPLLPQAESYLGLRTTEPDPSAVDRDLLATAFTVGVQDGGAGFVERLAELAATTSDPAVRQAAAVALGRTEDPEMSAALLADVLKRRFPVQVGLRVVFSQLARDATQASTFAWIREHAAEVFELIPGTFRSKVAGRGAVFCSAEAGQQWKTLIEAHAAMLPGYERSLAQAMESIGLCSELRATHSEDFTQALRARARRARR